MSSGLDADEGGMETAEIPSNAGFATALAELEESTARLIDLRHKVEHLAAGVAERQQALGELEQERSALRASADADRALVSSLESDVEGREELLGRLRNEVTALVAELDLRGDR
jgi:chromosome segregation ATPase